VFELDSAGVRGITSMDAYLASTQLTSLCGLLFRWRPSTAFHSFGRDYVVLLPQGFPDWFSGESVLSPVGWTQTKCIVAAIAQPCFRAHSWSSTQRAGNTPALQDKPAPSANVLDAVGVESLIDIIRAVGLLR